MYKVDPRSGIAAIKSMYTTNSMYTKKSILRRVHCKPSLSCFLIGEQYNLKTVLEKNREKKEIFETHFSSGRPITSNLSHSFQ